tara:strand:- start:504 stop:731 length:228 start_codon:yes stop_codon:yes gene_type:complete
VADVIPAFLRWPIALACAAVLAFGAGWWSGARDARHRAAVQAAEAYSDTLERMDHEGIDRGDSGAVLDRLRALSQ